MAEVKISELPSASSLTGSEVLPVVQGGSTLGATVNQIKDKIQASTLNVLKMNASSVQTLANIGELAFNPDTQTLEVKCSADVTLSIGQENYIRCKNAEASTILNGTVVYVSGGLGANSLIKRAGNADGTAERVIGVATQDIVANNIGFVTTSGIVNKLNTSAYIEGDLLWLGANGAMTNVKPDTSVDQICIGVVLRSHANEGSILVAVKDDWRDKLAEVRSDLNQKAFHGYLGTPKNLKNIEDLFYSLKNNVFSPESIRKGLIVNYPNAAIVPYSNGLSAVTEPILIPNDATELYLFSDQFVGQTSANLSFRNDIGDGPATYSSINVNGVPSSIPSGYKYVVVTIAKNDTLGATLDVTNIKIGFNSKFKNNTIKNEFLDVDLASFDFLSKDFKCFQMYKNSKLDLSWTLGGYGNITASTYYKSFLYLELWGFDKTKPHKLSMVRRNHGGIQDYSIIISEWSGSKWVKAAYWSKTGVNIEASNPGGIILYESTVSGKTIKAYIDYSFIPDNTSAMIGGAETTEPNFIIKQECFKEESPYLIESDVYSSDNMYYEDRMKMLETGNNKFNYLNAVIGAYTDSDTGAKYSTTSQYVAISEDIPVPEGATHVVTQGFLTNSSYTYPSSVCCMDENKDLIGGAKLLNYTAALLPGTKYIAVPLYRNVNPVPNPDWSDTLIAFSEVQIPYEPYRPVLKPEYLNLPDTEDLTNRITVVESEVLQIQENMSLYEENINLYEKNDAIVDLPVSVDGSDIKTGYAYIEQSTNYIKVK